MGAWPFDNTYARLPERFYARVRPTPVRAPRLLWLNEPLARELGLDVDELRGDEGAAFFAGNRVPSGAEPIALAYAGHQFGHFVPQLGDGRAILAGELVPPGGARRDVQWKGSGRTPFSRGGDGRAALGPVLREVLVGEAMHALGVPTTRSLGAAATGEAVLRERALPGAVVTRIAASHLRIGTFWYFASRRDRDAVRTLVTYALDRHDPSRLGAACPALALLEGVIQRQARLVARWMAVGFLHGVMNTDNTTISGETIDYGPCAFLDEYIPGLVMSSIDQQGRYAYANQPRIAAWNLARLAEALLTELHDDEGAAVATAEDALSAFPSLFEVAFRGELARKLGFVEATEFDDALLRGFLDMLAEQRADFTNAFRALALELRAGDGTGLPTASSRWSAWCTEWRERLAASPGGHEAAEARLRASNPAVIPRNHLVEAALDAAIAGDLAPFRELLAVITRPFEEPGDARFVTPPNPDERVRATFCGT